MLFYMMFGFVVIQRLVELRIAKKNEQWIRKKGAYEAGASHYPFMLALHIGFFLSLVIEVFLLDLPVSPLWMPLIFFFFVTQAARIWCLFSLGRFWNTKILILPGAQVVKKGPYNYIKHPNYLIVTIEILLLPLIFQAYVTAIVFTILNAAMLSVRIPVEEKALRRSTNYNKAFLKN